MTIKEYWSDGDKHTLCKNRKCIFDHWEEKKCREKVRKELQLTNELITGMMKGDEYYNITLEGQIRKREQLTKEFERLCTIIGA